VIRFSHEIHKVTLIWAGRTHFVSITAACRRLRMSIFLVWCRAAPCCLRLQAALLFSVCFAVNALAELAPLAPVAYADQAPAISLQDFFQKPVGPHGLLISERLRHANGKVVRLTGYVVQQEIATVGRFLLTPRPVLMSQHSDGEADDLPPATVLVRLSEDQQGWAVAHTGGLVEVTGTLEVGRFEERDGRVSWFRLQLAPDAIRAMTSSELTQHLHSLQHAH